MAIGLRHVHALSERATWINPATGERIDGGVHATGHEPGKFRVPGTVKTFTTPGHWEDVVLVLAGE